MRKFEFELNLRSMLQFSTNSETESDIMLLQQLEFALMEPDSTGGVLSQIFIIDQSNLDYFFDKTLLNYKGACQNFGPCQPCLFRKLGGS